MVSGYRVAVDYGTSFTAAAVVDGSVPEVVEFSSARHSRYLPSLVLVDQRGELHVGTRAVAKRGAVPADHVCVAPKRQLGPDPLQLGPRSLTSAEVVAATLAKVVEEVLHQHNGIPPHEVVMTHPAAWSEARRSLLRHAAVAAGLTTDPATVRLVSEPAAAVSFYARTGWGPEVPAGGAVAVYDLGGGTFDCAVLTRTDHGWRLAGPPGGDERLGGEDFDEALLEWVADRMLAEDPDAWGGFEDDDSPRGRSDWVSLLELIRSAKEELSHEETTEIGLPPGPLPLDSLLITRAEFTMLIGQALDRSMTAFALCLERAGVAPGDLSAVYLTGGSSRIPAVKAELHRRFGIEPTTYKDPKSITALGALSYDEQPVGASAAPESTPSAPFGGVDLSHIMDAFFGSGPESARRFSVSSAGQLLSALALTTAMHDEVKDPDTARVLLFGGGLPSLVGGNREQFVGVPLRGHGDDCETSFLPRKVVRWLGERPPNEPVGILVGPHEVTFACADARLGVEPRPPRGVFESMRPGPPSAVAQLDVGAVDRIQAGMQNAAAQRVPLHLHRDRIVVGYHQLGGPDLVGATVVEPLSGSLPGRPLLALLGYIRGLGRPGKITICAWPGLCELSFEDGDTRLYAEFQTAPGQQTQAAPPAPSPRTATVTVTARAMWGGVGGVGTTFTVEVDGRVVETGRRGRVSWETPVVLQLPPGAHVLTAYYQDFWRKKTSVAALPIQVAPGQQLSIRYEQPVTTVQKGRLRIT